jgi:hypothetical protein
VRTLDIQAFDDRSRPAGGHAVVRLMGLAGIPRSSAFVLRPLDATLVEQNPEVWPQGLSEPVETRPTEGGVELVLGVEFVDNPLLVPGTPVMIELPHEGAAGSTKAKTSANRKFYRRTFDIRTVNEIEPINRNHT